MSASAFGLAAALFVGLLCAVLANGGKPLPGDEPVHRWVLRVRGEPLDTLARFVTTVGGSVVAAAVVFAVAAVLAVRGLVRGVVAALVPVVVAVEAVVRSQVADAVSRPRPPAGDWITRPTGWAFPSGHTTNATFAFGLLAVIVWHAAGAGRERLRRGVAAACAAVAVAVGLSRVWLGVHWPTDVVGGWAFGGALLALIVATGVLGTSRPRGEENDG